jgi:S1-C subfamily serine protease
MRLPLSRCLLLIAALLAASWADAAERAELPAVPNVRAIVQARGGAAARVEAREHYLPGLFRRTARLLNPFPLRKTLGEAFSLVIFIPAIIAPRLRTHIGSGVLFDDEGHLLTNEHVIRDADEVRVQLEDAEEVPREFQAAIGGRDRQADIALLRIRPEDAPLVVAPLGDSEEMARGDWVVAIGTPLNLAGSVNTGVVSGLHRQVGAHELEDLIQVEAPLNPGNSGGPLLNARGEVIGIVSLGVFPSNNIGFAVPTSLIVPHLDDLKAGERPHRGYLGAALVDITPKLAEQRELDTTSGVLVEKVKWLGPADSAGLRSGDILLSYAGEKATKTREVQMAVLRTPPDSEVTIRVRREGKTLRFRVRLGERRRPIRIF